MWHKNNEFKIFLPRKTLTTVPWTLEPKSNMLPFKYLFLHSLHLSLYLSLSLFLSISLSLFLSISLCLSSSFFVLVLFLFRFFICLFVSLLYFPYRNNKFEVVKSPSPKNVFYPALFKRRKFECETKLVLEFD